MNYNNFFDVQPLNVLFLLMLKVVFQRICCNFWGECCSI